jgi:hypothetical protein
MRSSVYSSLNAVLILAILLLLLVPLAVGLIGRLFDAS